MKKSLAALAVLGAFAGSAFAADVTLYGLVDYGFNPDISPGPFKPPVRRGLFVVAWCS